MTQYDEWIRPNGQWIGYVVLGILVLLCIFLGSLRLMEWNKTSAWKQYYAVMHSENAVEGLEALADKIQEPIASRAKLTLAQILLAQACNEVFTDKEKR